MKEQSRFYSSLGLLVVLNAVIKPLWIFGIDRQVQNTVGTTEYGTYFSLLNLSIVFSFLLDWGLTNYFNRQLASRQENLVSPAGNFLLIKLLFVAGYAIVLTSIAAASGIDRRDIIAGVFGIQVTSSLFLFFRAIITAQQWFRTDAILSILDKTLMILACSVLLYFPGIAGGMTIKNFLALQILCTAISIVITLLLLFQRKVKFVVANVSTIFSRKLWKEILPYGLIVLLMSVHYRLDGFLLERIHPDGAHEAGVYAAGYRLLDAGNMISTLFTLFLLPFIARLWSEQKEITSVVLTLRHFLVVLAIGISSIAIFLAPWLQQLLYPNSNGSTAEVLQWCLPALIGYSLVNIYGTVMTATGHIRSFCTITAIAVAVNIVLNGILIPQFGAKGSCIAALISQTGCGIATMLFVKKRTQVNIDYRSLAIYILIAILIGVVLYGGNNLSVNPWLSIAIACLLAIGGMLATGLLKLSEWKRSLKKSHL
jgi:O-antigen/teichoic acid export membrane protein